MTTENNKIIAEFMGYEWFEVNKPYIAVKNVNGSVHFRTDWNDLMEVVEKIESLNYDVIILHSSTEITSCDIDFQTIFGNSETYSKIESVYNACLEFIKWYNKQNK